MLALADIVCKRCRADARLYLRTVEEEKRCMCCLFHLAMIAKALLTLLSSACRKGTRGQLDRAVKAIDSKSIGVTRVSSSLTAVALFKSALRVGASRHGCFVVLMSCCFVALSFVRLSVGWFGSLGGVICSY